MPMFTIYLVNLGRINIRALTNSHDTYSLCEKQIINILYHRANSFTDQMYVRLNQKEYCLLLPLCRILLKYHKDSFEVIELFSKFLKPKNKKIQISYICYMTINDHLSNEVDYWKHLTIL